MTLHIKKAGVRTRLLFVLSPGIFDVQGRRGRCSRPLRTTTRKTPIHHPLPLVVSPNTPCHGRDMTRQTCNVYKKQIRSGLGPLRNNIGRISFELMTGL